MSTTISRITDNQGLRVGFGENTGLSMEEYYKGLTATSGTVSVVPTAQFAYYNLVNNLTANTYINVNATYSLINDQMTVLCTAGGNTFSLLADTTSNVRFTTVVVNANKAVAVNLIYNGTNYISYGSAQ